LAVEDVLAKPSQAAQKTEMYARLSGLWSDFRDSGVVPPPKSYRGIKVLTPTEVMTREQASAGDESTARPGLSPLEEARITLIQHALRRLAEIDRGEGGAYVGSQESPADEDHSVDVSIPARAVTSDGQVVDIEMSVRYSGSGVSSGGDGSVARMTRPFVAHVDATSEQLGGGRFSFEIEADDVSRRTDRGGHIPADAADAGLRVWATEGGRRTTLEAVGEPRRAAVYVGGASRPESPSVRPVPRYAGGSGRGGGIYVAPRLLDAAV
jgi:hypothetical protein